MTTLEMMLARFGVSSAPTITLKAGRREMSQLFSDIGSAKGAEIGVWRGKWSARICADNPRLEMLCVDLWATYQEYTDARNNADALADAYAMAKQALAPYRATMIRKTSTDAAHDVPDGSLDFVYIDGNHTEPFVKMDLEAWAPKVRSGGIVSGHDYLWRKEKPYIQVKAAVDRYVADHQISPLFVFAADTVPSFAWVQP